MARPRKNPLPSSGALPAPGNFSSWAESLGEALGRGVAHGISTGLSTSGLMTAGASPAPTPSAVSGARRRGRPPKAQLGGPVPADRRCKVEGCGREARSKGLCSAHYQAERRRQISRSK